MVRGVVTDVTGDPLQESASLSKVRPQVPLPILTVRYSINVPSTGTLIFSYIGMAKHEVKTQGQTTINVSLSEDVSSLNEVVVVGYGSQKKASVVGAISTADAKELQKTGTTNLTQAIGGRIAGVISRSPGGVRVRMMLLYIFGVLPVIIQELHLH